MADGVGPPVPTATTPTPCVEEGEAPNAWIDKFHNGMYDRGCGTAMWFDSLFGNPRFDRDSDETYGRIGVFETLDRRDGLNSRLAMRARVALPAMHNRMRLTLNRRDDEYGVDEPPSGNDKTVPQSFSTVDDESWLLGLGYSRRGVPENGFDFGIGVQLRAPLDPYVKTTYRHCFVFNQSTALVFRETPFWRDSRGFGAATEVTVDHLLRPDLLRPDLLLRWNNAGTVAQDTEGLKWGTNVSAYKDLKNRSAISYTALLRGETGADITIQNYGLETRYRRQTFRKWLFLDLSASVTWPRESLEEQRET
ncbi:MAG: hypothetical protein ABI661_02645, partial [Gammaproteobacteria bacterium]